MSWLWLGLLVLVGAGLWLLRRRRLRDDAALQESLDHLGPHAEPKRPPAKQPWRRPGFGPAPRMSALDLGSGPLPPPAGVPESPEVAGPMPDDEDVPALIPVDMSDEVEGDDQPSAKPPIPPPPPPPSAAAPPSASPPSASVSASASASASHDGGIEDPADDPVAATIDELDAITDDYDADDVEAALRRGPRVIELPPELADEVRELMGRRQEVAAVRLICDSMGVGILDAQRTVRSLIDS